MQTKNYKKVGTPCPSQEMQIIEKFLNISDFLKKSVKVRKMLSEAS